LFYKNLSCMDLSIIIVNYKSKHKLDVCLESIKASNLGGFSYETVVIENNSGEDLSYLNNLYPDLRLIVSSKNLGMGGGNNLGIKEAKGDYVLILNPDTVLKSDAIYILLKYLKENQQVGLVGPQLLNSDGSLQLSCSRFPSFFIPVLRRTFLGEYFKNIRERFTMSEINHDEIQPVDWLMGSCLMFKKKLPLADGTVCHPRFDDRYFMYFEDTDLCKTIINNGYQVIYNPRAVVVHDHARESAKNPWYVAILKDKITWIHISSWLKYFLKWGFLSGVKNNNKYYEKD